MTHDLKLRCKNCDRFIKLKAIESSEVVVTCTDRKCKSDNTIKVVMLSSMVGQPKSEEHSHQPDPKLDEYKKTITELESKIADLDSTSKEAEELKAQLEDLQNYIKQLEGIIDGQG